MKPNFSTFVHSLSYDDLPDAVLTTLRRSFTDTMGVAAIGTTTPLSDIVRRVAPMIFGVGGAGGATMLMDGRSVSPAGAAMAGAFTVDSVDAHDGTTPCKGHAGSAVFPSLIAMAQAEASRGRPMDGRRFAEVLATGYEASYRAGLVQHATCADYHTSGAWTAVGVAAAGAKLLGGDAAQIGHAAGIGEYHGPRSQMMRCIDHPTMLRDGVGWGAPSGVTAAYLALEGFTGAPALTCDSADAEPFWADIGENWRLVEDTHYKAYPCCRWAHPAMDGASALMQAHDLAHQQVAEVEIRTFHYATRLAGHAPQSLDEFSYAIAFPVATMIVRGQVGVDELHPDTLKDPDILRISHATRLIDDAEMTRISTDKRWAQVTLVLKDGRRVEAAPRTPRGDPDHPLSDEALCAKFHLFADPVLGRACATEIKELSGVFDTLCKADFQRLLALCTKQDV